MQNLVRNKHVRVEQLKFKTFLSILNLVVALFFLVDLVFDYKMGNIQNINIKTNQNILSLIIIKMNVIGINDA